MNNLATGSKLPYTKPTLVRHKPLRDMTATGGSPF